MIKWKYNANLNSPSPEHTIKIQITKRVRFRQEYGNMEIAFDRCLRESLRFRSVQLLAIVVLKSNIIV